MSTGANGRTPRGHRPQAVTHRATGRINAGMAGSYPPHHCPASSPGIPRKLAIGARILQETRAAVAALRPRGALPAPRPHALPCHPAGARRLHSRTHRVGAPQKLPTGGCPIGPDPTVLELQRRRRRRPPPAPRLLHWVCSCGGGGGGSGGGHAEKQRVAHSLARPRCLRLRLIMTSVTAMPPRVVGLGHSRKYRGCSWQRRLR